MPAIKCEYCNHLFKIEDTGGFKDAIGHRVRVHQNRCKYATPEERSEWKQKGKWPRKNKETESVN